MTHIYQGEGGKDHVSPYSFSTKSQLPTVVYYSNPPMLKAREKRKTRRQTEAREVQSRGMDILPFYAKTRNQENLWDSLNKNTITVAIGAAGVGKTLTALWWGLDQVSKNQIEKIYYVRSDIGCAHQRGRGALPGTMDEKMAPLVGPVYDNLSVITKSFGATEYLLTKKIVHPMLLEDLRGRSFSDSLIVFDEAQNSTIDQCKTVLSRVAENSTVLLTGDTRQIDLNVFQSNSGLIDAYHRLDGIRGVGTIQFTPEDIVRNGIIAEILNAYEKG